ncbi:hypothetical protein VW35_16455 [Devosia soli]|uniref:Uncharacterized protein n=1 Tax=Devosia soli TaxID=361041 RepID=A0A0F5L3A3_9HYPH|nr:hypothetical protein [Devosia soli]KKB76901.1 hypothetical protein VW35_16455 [Devosia soli]
MKFRQLFNLCLKLGLSDREARRQIELAEALGFQSDDPYLNLLVLEGLLLHAVILNDRTIKIFRAEREGYPDLIAEKVREAILPILADVAVKAAERSVTSHLSTRRRLLESITIFAVTALLAFPVGALSQQNVNAFWIGLTAGSATSVAEMLTLNPMLPQQFAECKSSIATKFGNSPGDYVCPTKPIVYRTGNPVETTPFLNPLLTIFSTAFSCLLLGAGLPPIVKKIKRRFTQGVVA